MKPLSCLTLFLESGKRFKLPSGETFDQLRQPQPSSTSSTASVSPPSTTTGKPTFKPRTELQRSMLLRQVEQRVKNSTPEQRAQVEALWAKHKASKKG